VPSTSSLSLARIMRVITSHKRRPIMRRGVGNILSSACGSWWDGRQYQFSAARIVALKGQLNTAAHR
jgi:hypothetical protein